MYSRCIFSKLDYKFADDVYAFGTLVFLLCSNRLPYNRRLPVHLVKLKRASIESPTNDTKVMNSAVSGGCFSPTVHQKHPSDSVMGDSCTESLEMFRMKESL